MNTPSLSIEEIEMLLNYWENKIDETKWDDTTRESVIELLTESKESYEWWMDHLVKVPDNVRERYHTMIKKLLDARMITQKDYDEELVVMQRMSQAKLAREGKKLAEWYRSEQALR